VIHLYGVVDSLAELPPLAGLEGAPLERRSLAGLEVVVSRTDVPPAGEVSREDVLRHAEVVEELASRSRAVLPAQFGRAFADDDELAAVLSDRAQELGRGLERVRGCVEFGLRAIPGEPRAVVEASSGTDYLRTRLDEVRRGDRLTEEIHEPLARLARESTIHRGAGGELNAAYLVPDENVEAFRDEAARAEASRPATVVCAGPWPPYSFADGGEDL
jgi:hypothetical protein